MQCLLVFSCEISEITAKRLALVQSLSGGANELKRSDDSLSDSNGWMNCN